MASSGYTWSRNVQGRYDIGMLTSTALVHKNECKSRSRLTLCTHSGYRALVSIKNEQQEQLTETNEMTCACEYIHPQGVRASNEYSKVKTRRRRSTSDTVSVRAQGLC